MNCRAFDILQKVKTSNKNYRMQVRLRKEEKIQKKIMLNQVKAKRNEGNKLGKAK